MFTKNGRRFTFLYMREGKINNKKLSIFLLYFHGIIRLELSR